jgi:DNA-binding response OmpR family regulator
MVTSKGEEDKVVEGYTAGCNDYVTKPIDPIVLNEKIKNLL